MMLPLYLELEGRTVVIFGGGAVALRKARYLTKGSVTIVSREFHPDLRGLPVRLIEGEALDHIDLVDDAFLVVAATGDPEVNAAIAERARGAGAFLNRDDEVGTFLIPSVVEGDGFSIAISTLGRSPGFSRYLRRRLESSLGEELGRMVRLQEELREEARTVIPDQEGRERFLRSILEDEGIWRSIAEDYEEARAMALARLRVREHDT
jgi:precorrin-2 dehydrogenase/sirohydrochlorin ferrochelatase